MQILLRCTSSEEATLVLSSMRKGAVFMAIKNDPVIHELSRRLIQRSSYNPHHINTLMGGCFQGAHRQRLMCDRVRRK